MKGSSDHNTKKQYCMYVVLDRDTGERFETTDRESLESTIRRRDELALTYGKQFCLGVAGIDADGRLHDITEEIEP